MMCFYLVPPPSQYSPKIFNSISLALVEVTIEVVVVAVVVVVVAVVVVVLVVIVVAVVVVIVVECVVCLGGGIRGLPLPLKNVKEICFKILISCSRQSPWFFIVFFGNILESATLFSILFISPVHSHSLSWRFVTSLSHSITLLESLTTLILYLLWLHLSGWKLCKLCLTWFCDIKKSHLVIFKEENTLTELIMGKRNCQQSLFVSYYSSCWGKGRKYPSNWSFFHILKLLRKGMAVECHGKDELSWRQTHELELWWLPYQLSNLITQTKKKKKKKKKKSKTARTIVARFHQQYVPQISCRIREEDCLQAKARKNRTLDNNSYFLSPIFWGLGSLHRFLNKAFSPKACKERKTATLRSVLLSALENMADNDAAMKLKICGNVMNPPLKT